MIIFYVLYINNSYDLSWQLLMYLLIVIFSITVWRYILFWVPSYVHGFDDFTDTWLHSCTSRVLLMACVWVYNKMITQKKILLCQNFFPGRRECRIIFYIFLAYGSHGGWSKAIITLMMILFEQRHYVMVHVMVHH